MKSIFFVFFTLALFGCDEEELSIDEIEKAIIGKWKMVENSYSIGGPRIHNKIENGVEITFASDLTFNYSFDHDCNRGSYELEDRILKLIYSCVKTESNIDYHITERKYKIELNGFEEFVLYPSGPFCAEGCSYKYQKL